MVMVMVMMMVMVMVMVMVMMMVLITIARTNPTYCTTPAQYCCLLLQAAQCTCIQL